MSNYRPTSANVFNCNAVYNLCIFLCIVKIHAQDNNMRRKLIFLLSSLDTFNWLSVSRTSSVRSLSLSKFLQHKRS